MIAKLGKFWRLSWAERALLFQAALWLPVTRLGLRIFGFQRLQQTLVRWYPETPDQHPSEVADRRRQTTTRLVIAAANHGLLHSSCLVRSMTLWWLLRRQGIASSLRIGVQKAENRFAAHAWVEANGIVLNDRPDVSSRYARFDRTFLPEAEVSA